jgi:tRNA1Val (adenine37-N6)-methyltransferase
MNRPDETIDPLGLMPFRLIQPQKGYRCSMDPFLLCGFSGFRGEKVIYDLGCGNGVIPLLVAMSSKANRIVGVERQPQMVERARRSVELNAFGDRVSIVEEDIRQVEQGFRPMEADLVLSNPPFRPPENGRVSSNDERAAARHELAGGLDTFLNAARYLLKDGGRFCLVFLPERSAELLVAMKSYQLEPKRMRLCHHTVGEEASLIFVEAVKGSQPGMTVDPPLVVYKGTEKDYTEEVLAMYGMNETRDE